MSESPPRSSPRRRWRRTTLVAVASAFLASGIVAVVVATTPSPAAARTPFEVPAGAGATVPFIQMEAEAASTNGTMIGPSNQQGTVASEASGRRAVQLPATGRFVEFTLTRAANAVTLAYNLPRGVNGNISIYLNGVKQAPGLALSSRFMYLDTGWIAGSQTHHLFAHDRIIFGSQVASGGRVRFQVDAGDVVNAVLDTADFELVGAPLPQPAGSLSVTSAGADPSGNGDSTNAFNQTIVNARNAGQIVWIPPGNFRITSPLQIHTVTMRGAGQWYSVLRGTHLIDNGSSPGAIRMFDFAAIGEVTIRNDGAADNFVNGSLGNGSVVSNIWIQHQKVGLWLVGPNNANLTIENNRFLDLTADGLNLNGTVTNAMIRNNYLRNTGDDSLAMWSIHAPNVGNTFTNNTIVQPNLANGIAIYGGRDTTVSNNVIADTNALGSGIAISNQQFIADNFQQLAGTITVSNNHIIRGGAFNPNWQHAMGAIRVDAYDFPISNGVQVNITGGAIYESPYAAFEIVGGAGTGQVVTSLAISGVSVQGVGTTVMQMETGGQGTFSNIVATGVAIAGIYNCAFPANQPLFTFNLGTGNSGWQGSTWPGCVFPSPGTGPPTGGPPTSGPPPPPPNGNLALFRPVTETSHSDVYVATNAVDGNPNTYWESANNAFPQSLTVDLGSSVSTGRVVLKLPPPAAWQTRTQTLAVLASNDGGSFSTVVGAAGYTFNPATGNTVTINLPVANRRFLRLTFTGNTGWPAGQVAEFEVYGDPGNPPPPPSSPPPSSPPPGPAPGTNVAQGKPIAETSHADVYVATNAVDGNTSSYWESANNAFPQSLTVDLQSSIRVNTVTLKLPPPAAWGTRTQTLTILGSTNGTTFSTLVASRGYTFNPASGNTATVTFTATSVRFVRLTFTANTGWPAGQVSEFQVLAA